MAPNKDGAIDLRTFQAFQDTHVHSDRDRNPNALHHTLGKHPHQAAPGNHGRLGYHDDRYFTEDEATDLFVPIDGNKQVNDFKSFAFGGIGYGVYQERLTSVVANSGGTALGWHTIGTVTLTAGAGMFSGYSGEVEIIDGRGNWGQSTPQKVYYSFSVRGDEGSNNAEVRGPEGFATDFFRIVKVSTYVFKLQMYVYSFHWTFYAHLIRTSTQLNASIDWEPTAVFENPAGTVYLPTSVAIPFHQGDWIPFPFNANWGNGSPVYGPWQDCQYTIDVNGWIIVRGFGLTSIARAAGNHVIGTLPVGFRPAFNEMFTSWTAVGPMRMDFVDNGNIQIEFTVAPGANSWFSLSGIRHRLV